MSKKEGQKGYQRFVDWVLGWVLKLRPTAYNKITWALIIVGSGMVASGIPFVSVVLLAGWNEIIGDPAYLEKLLLVSGGKEAYGVCLIGVALLYNLACQYGESLLKRELESQADVLSVNLVTLADEKIPSAFSVPGGRVEEADALELSEWSGEDLHGTVKAGSVLNRLLSNKKLYFERYDFLRKYGGAIGCRLRVENLSGSPVNKIKLEMKLVGECDIWTESIDELVLPSKIKRPGINTAPLVLPGYHPNALSVKRSDGGWRISWFRLHLHPKAEVDADDILWIKPAEKVVLTVSVFADELPMPRSISYTFEPAESLVLKESSVISDEKFESLVGDQCVAQCLKEVVN